VRYQGATVNPVDASGRITLKEHQDERLPRLVYLTQGLDGCILVLQERERDEIASTLTSLPLLDPDADDLRRMFLAPCTEVRIDGQRRLKIPEPLRDWAELEPGNSRALLLDLGTRFEIWEEERYRSYMAARAKELKQVTRRLWGRGQSEEAEDEAQ